MQALTTPEGDVGLTYLVQANGRGKRVEEQEIGQAGGGSTLFKRGKREAPVRRISGLTSYILLQQGDVASDNLAITWVDVEPGSGQQPHRHSPEQVYVITQGQGRMQVGEEYVDAEVGDMVFIPPDTVHSMTNTGSETLTYVSASTPAFDLKALYDTGELSR